MAERQVKTIRASETVSPYGPGAVVDILGQSFMVPTGDRWPSPKVRTQITSERLADALGVDELWGAPTTHDPDNSRVPSLEFERFPAWLFCQACRRMVHWKRQMENGGVPHCAVAGCDGRLVPMRFVAVCTEESHVADVPWAFWMHRDAQGDCTAEDQLRFENAEGRSGGLSSLRVRCERCGHSRSLGELRRDVFRAEGITCHGTQPWQQTWGQCGKPLDPQQRGATSLHFSDIVSAIDIPAVESRADEFRDSVQGHVFYGALRAAEPGSSTSEMLAREIASDLGVEVDDVLLAAGPESAQPSSVRMTRSGLQSAEFEAFIKAIAGDAPVENFHTRVATLPGAQGNAAEGLGALISDIVMVDRLRDVRAVIGFRRHTPDAKLVPAVAVEPHMKTWLPAVEGYGEGIFLRFAPDAVMRWRQQAAVEERGAVLLRHQNQSVLGLRLHAVSAEYVLLHTFAHLLMRELAFSSGYTSSSIRERIYCESDGDYGVFIYTTSSDVEGTLGGLVRQGEPDLLAQAIVRALEQAAWCPNDPVCIETEAQSIDGLTMAACHACCLAPETSCESQNLLLDRALVVGGGGVTGYFGAVVDGLLGQRG
ncbi:DUF1998 domain-containing protein [Microbacterium terrisoli]|uniref:DUF1998 domain-containing protein n=1 Tax=Microbacterium terrisoli TaxID=3242192 RepID=UPI0028047501|nr:DUF1998 domain-containing protein [Microbacterium protaetiae]